MQSNKIKKEKILKIIFFFLLLSILLIFKIGCPIKLILHLYCPGCGITRMFLSILRLDFYQAFRYNPLVFILIPLILINKIFIKETNIQKLIWWILLIIVIIFGILRNISIFSYLAPTKI